MTVNDVIYKRIASTEHAVIVIVPRPMPSLSEGMIQLHARCPIHTVS